MMKRDRLNFVDGYFAGATEMASASCQNMQYSNMTAFCFNPEKEYYLKAIAKEFGCTEEELQLEESKISIKDFFENQFGDDKYSVACAKRLQTVVYYHVGLETEAFQFKNLAKIRDMYSGYGGGSAPYHYVEDMFLQVYEEGCVLFVVGNDE